MKICWDNLEGLCLTKNGIFRKGEATYIEMGACKVCGEPYLAQKRKYISSFCGHSCAGSGENNQFFGKIHTVETRKKMSKAHPSRRGILSFSYKGDKAGFANYNTYKDRLELYEDIRKQEGTEVLEVRCTYCNCWYVPTYKSVGRRLEVINKLNQGEGRLYCSENCKQACPTYGQKKYPKGFKKATSREVSTYLRQMVFERDGWECQKCGKTIKQVQLHCHHINGYAQNKILANDVDNCITLCKDCHKEVHKLPGCRYVDLRCKD